MCIKYTYLFIILLLIAQQAILTFCLKKIGSSPRPVALVEIN